VRQEVSNITQDEYGLDDCLIYCVQHCLFFLINIVQPCDKQIHSQVGKVKSGVEEVPQVETP
jgi:hypothetical protein